MTEPAQEPNLIHLSELKFTEKVYEIMESEVTESIASAIILTCRHFGVDIEEAKDYLTASMIDMLGNEENLIDKSATQSLI